MKIIQVGPFPIKSDIVGGGVEAAVHGLALELSHHHEVVVLDFPRKFIENDHIENGLLRVFRFSSKTGGYFSKVLRVFSYVKVVKRLDYDIVHIHTTTFISFMIFLLLRVMTKSKVLVTIHGLAHVEMSNKFKSDKSLKSFFKFVFQSFVEFVFIDLCSSFIVDTTYVENRLMEYKNEHKILRMPHCVVIPQGVNENFFELRRTSTSTMNILSIGAFNRRKGHLELLYAFEQVLKTVPNLHLDIAGTISDLSYFEMIRQKVLEMKMSSYVTLYPNVSNEKLNSLYENARLFVLHTQEESQGIVFCEAMALGLPIVTTNVGGIPYILKHGVNALLSPYGDVTLFSSNIIKLLTEPSFEDQMSKSNLLESTLYNWRSIAIKVLNQYESNKSN